MPDSWGFEPLTRSHDRREFACGQPSLDEYLRRYARQNDDRGLGRTVVAVRRGDPSKRVWGYVTLSAGRIPLDQVPEESRRGLPTSIPVILLARMAVDRRVQGAGLGGLLLAWALSRSLEVSTLIGALAVEVVAVDDRARDFYRHFGFRELTDDARHLWLPMATIRSAAP